jgi:hypothetical protein
MDKRHALALLILLLLLLLGWFISRRVLDRADRTGVVGGPAAPQAPHELPEDAEVRGEMVYTARDVEIFQAIMDRVEAERLDTLAIGDLIVALGRPFVGEPYTPQTLEIPGPGAARDQPA